MPRKKAAPAAQTDLVESSQGLGAIVGQDRALGVIRSFLAGGRLANAYLFHGPWGVGKTSAALAFARALLCPHRGATGDACGECPGCHRAARFQHADLRFLFPVSGEEATLDETIAETLEAMRSDPLHVFVYEKAASIRIGLTRELLKELAFRPYEAERRVVVLRDADRMREDQYSAMLKSLEEPGQSTVWLLTTSRPERLPGTIRSRTLRVRFAAIAEPVIERFLVERAEVPTARARLLAAVSAGSIGRALLWRDEDVREARDQAIAMLGPALAKDAGRMLADASKVARGWNRETLRRVLEFQILWLRDVLRTRYGADPETLVNRDLAAEIARAAKGVDAGEIHRRLAVLEEVGRAIEGNVNPEMAFFSGLARLGGLIPERLGDWPEHEARVRVR
ncbi:MAG TPA: DNA polymerase III subunit delta' C-terminal domain-containing protein [Candidatus Eisenbacteria bacterium]|nr:DNA polymerase III subunit delta' C-terminal domain-containing protein [Candidatus Eisenbacteria bacterium]